VQVALVENATHGYVFWPGWAVEDKRHVGRVFVASDLQGIAVVQNAWPAPLSPECEMEALGFGELRLTWKAVGVKAVGAWPPKGPLELGVCRLEGA
jgi:hypothetical protein